MNFKDTREVYLEARFIVYCEENGIDPYGLLACEDLRPCWEAAIKATREPIKPGHCDRTDEIMGEHR